VNPLWRIELLGWLRLVGADRVIDRFRTQKAASLLAFLACHSHRSHPREELIELFWPEGSPETSRRSLRVALTSLRHQLEPPEVPAGTVLIADRAAVRLNPTVCVTDVSAFEAAVQAAARTDDPAEETQQLAEAARLYRGDLLPGFFDDWVLAERPRLFEAHLQVLEELAAACEAAGDEPGALQWSRRAVRADPLSEEGHQHLIRLLAAAGQPASALRQYRDLERLLRVELRAAPEAALRALARELEAQVAAVHLGDVPHASAEAPSVIPSPVSLPHADPARAADAAAASTVGYERRITLPPQFTRFFGREAEIVRLEALLLQGPPARRLVTLTGPGGTGKTRLRRKRPTG
jgi:DNA-binding SARP family transcriptional activator